MPLLYLVKSQIWVLNYSKRLHSWLFTLIFLGESCIIEHRRVTVTADVCVAFSQQVFPLLQKKIRKQLGFDISTGFLVS